MRFNRLKHHLKKFFLNQKDIHTNFIIRRIFTQNFSCGKVALGERNTYTNPLFPLDWIRVDWQDADYTINLNQCPILPFSNNSQKLIYSAHMIEHLSESVLLSLFKECCRVLKPGGKIRLEAPDAEKLINLYRSGDKKMLSHFYKFRKNVLVDRLGYPQSYLEDHLSVLGEISSYIVPEQGVHIPVYASKEEFENKIETLNLDDFCNWCISLQTLEQRKSGGHQNAIYFSKLYHVLEKAGFSNIIQVDFGYTKIPELELNNGFWSIQEKPHRTFYSLFVEAEKTS